MSGLDLLTSLPISVIHAVLCEWVSLLYWPKLDSACCNRRKRESLLALFQTIDFVYGEKLEVNSTSGMIVWANLRKVKFSSIVCRWGYREVEDDQCGTNVTNPTFRKSQLHTYLQQFQSCVRVLHLDAKYGSVTCTHLTDLTTTLTEDTCRLIANNPHLQKLTFLYGPHLRSEIVERYCELLQMVELPELKEVTVVMLRTQRGDWPFFKCLVQVLKMAYRLENFTIVGHFQLFPTDSWVAISELCPYLQTLHAIGTYVEDGAMVQFTARCPHITSLSIEGNLDFTDEGVLQVVQNLPHLSSLELGLCRGLTDTCLLYIAAHCSKLETLKLHHIAVSAPAAEALQNKLSNLTICFSDSYGSFAISELIIR